MMTLAEALGIVGFVFSGIAFVIGGLALYKVHRLEIEKEG